MKINGDKSTKNEIADGLKDIGKAATKSFFSSLFSTVGVLIGGGVVGAIAGGAVALVYGLTLQFILWGAIAGFVIALAIMVFLHSASSLW